MAIGERQLSAKPLLLLRVRICSRARGFGCPGCGLQLSLLQFGEWRLLPGDLVCAGHRDQLLPQQDAVPGLHCDGAPHRDRPFPRFDLGAQVPAELPDDVFAAVH